MTNAKRALRSGFVNALELRVENRLGRRHVTDRQVERQIGFVGLGERQPRDRHVVRPHVLEPLERSASVVLTPRSAPNQAAFALVVFARSRPSRSSGSSSARHGRPVVGRREPPEHRARVVEQLLQVELVRFHRQRCQQRCPHARSGATLPSSIASHSVTSAAPRVSGSAIDVRVSSEEVERAGVELEDAVAETAGRPAGSSPAPAARRVRHRPLRADRASRPRSGTSAPRPIATRDLLRPEEAAPARIRLPKRELA